MADKRSNNFGTNYCHSLDNSMAIRTLKQVAETFTAMTGEPLTRQGVLVIEKRAFEKLRHLMKDFESLLPPEKKPHKFKKTETGITVFGEPTFDDGSSVEESCREWVVTSE